MNPDDERELLREAERVVDRVFRVAEEQDDKTEQTIALGVATLAGGLALASFASANRPLDPIAFLLLAVGGVANLAALHRFLDAYLGLAGSGALLLGPDPGWLAERAADAAWDPAAHRREVLAALADDTRLNVLAIARVAGTRRDGLSFLLFALTSYAIGAFYILARSVFT